MPCGKIWKNSTCNHSNTPSLLGHMLAHYFHKSPNSLSRLRYYEADGQNSTLATVAPHENVTLMVAKLQRTLLWGHNPLCWRSVTTTWQFMSVIGRISVTNYRACHYPHSSNRFSFTRVAGDYHYYYYFKLRSLSYQWLASLWPQW